MTMEAETAIQQLVLDTLQSTELLYKNDFRMQLLILVFSSIDAMGLLGAAPSVSKASGTTFKDWAGKYLLNGTNMPFNEVDLWGARCAVLHTQTSLSDLSAAGKARQIQWYAGDPETDVAKTFVTLVSTLEKGSHVAGHFDSFYKQFCVGVGTFATDLLKTCRSDAAVEKRVLQILQQFKV